MSRAPRILSNLASHEVHKFARGLGDVEDQQLGDARSFDWQQLFLRCGRLVGLRVAKVLDRNLMTSTFWRYLQVDVTVWFSI